MHGVLRLGSRARSTRKAGQGRQSGPNTAEACRVCACRSPGQIMAHEEIDAIRAMLAERPRPVGWAERRAQLDEVGSIWPIAGDMSCESVDCGGVAGEWSRAPGADPSRVLLFFHGGGYCAGSIASHRRMATELRPGSRLFRHLLPFVAAKLLNRVKHPTQTAGTTMIEVGRDDVAGDQLTPVKQARPPDPAHRRRRPRRRRA